MELSYNHVHGTRTLNSQLERYSKPTGFVQWPIIWRYFLATAERLRDPEYQGLASSAAITSIAARDFFFWHILIMYYTRCNIKKITDRLPGITSIMMEIQKASGFAIHDGIWHFDSHSCALELLWAVTSHHGKRIENRVPTWSWGAVDTSIEYPLDSPSGDYTTEVKILSVFSLSLPLLSHRPS